MRSYLLTISLLASLVSRISSGKDDFSSLPDLSSAQPTLIHNGTQDVILKYFSSSELDTFVMELGEKFYKTVDVKSLGVSAVGKRDIWAVHISRNVHFTRSSPSGLMKPMIKFVANIHGDDAVGYALIVALIQYLVYNDGLDARITKMLDNIHIWIVPTLNPDGFSNSKMGQCNTLPGKKGFTNGNGVDLDQNFPDDFNFLKKGPLQPETEAMIKFITENPFVLSANLQGGALVASYPFDTKKFCTGGYSQDFVYLAEDYARLNPMMSRENACNESFKNGITNGYSWRKKYGGMQDFNYLKSDCVELTFYLGCCKYPYPSDLPHYWTANLESMLNFIESSLQGVFGFVHDGRGSRIATAVIKLKGKDKVTRVDEWGTFRRPLPEGAYVVTASAPGHETVTRYVTVGKKQYVHENFALFRNRKILGVPVKV